MGNEQRPLGANQTFLRSTVFSKNLDFSVKTNIEPKTQLWSYKL